VKSYDIKLEVTMWYDKNYTIEAHNKNQAMKIAKDYAKHDLECFENVDLISDEGESWTYGDIELQEVYTEENEDGKSHRQY